MVYVCQLTFAMNMNEQCQVTLLARLALVALVSTRIKVDRHLVHIKGP
jgi:hypothetical protein